MVFQQFQKIQKPCLVLITAFITVTFGVGTAMLTWANPPEYSGKIGETLITESEFVSHGQTMRLTRRPTLGEDLNKEESVWVDLMVDVERKRAEVFSTDDEVMAYLQLQAPPNQSPEDFVRSVEGKIKLARMTQEQYFDILKRNFSIDKFRRYMGLEKKEEYQFQRFFSYYRTASPSYAETLVTSEQALKKLREKKRKVKVKWVGKDKSDYKDKVSLKARLAKEYKDNSSAFQIGKKISGEFVLLPFQAGTLQKRASIGELYRYFLQHREEFIEPRRAASDPVIYSTFEKSKERVQLSIWREKNFTQMPTIRKAFVDSKSPSLKKLAQQYSLTYGSFSSLLEEEFTEKVPQLAENAGTVFRLKEGEISTLLNTRRGQVLVFLSQIEKPYIPKFKSLEDEKAKELAPVEELALLKKYFHETLYQFEDPTQYKIQIATANFNQYQTSNLITTHDLKEFYDKYREVLFSGKSFVEVRLDIEGRLKKIKTGEEIPTSFANFQRKLQEDEKQELSFPEVAKSFGLTVLSSEKAMELKDLRKKYPFISEEDSEQIEQVQVGKLSKILYSKVGDPYIVSMLQVKRSETPKFDDIQDKVKEKLIEDELAKVSLEEFKKLQEKAQEDFDKVKDKLNWKLTDWFVKDEPLENFSKEDRGLIRERINNLKEVGEVGELVVGKDKLYLIRLEAEEKPDKDSFKKFEIYDSKEGIVAEGLEALRKRWTDFEELKDYMQLELVKKEEKLSEDATESEDS